MPSVLKQVANDMANAFTRWNLWRGGASTLPELEDISLNNVQNGDVLQYDSTSEKWVNTIVSGGSLGGKVEFITQITVLPLPIDFTKYDLYLYIARNQDNYNMGSVTFSKNDFPTDYVFMSINDNQRIIIKNGNQMYENSSNCKVYLYGIKFAPIEPIEEITASDVSETNYGNVQNAIDSISSELVDTNPHITIVKTDNTNDNFLSAFSSGGGIVHIVGRFSTSKIVTLRETTHFFTIVPDSGYRVTLLNSFNLGFANDASVCDSYGSTNSVLNYRPLTRQYNANQTIYINPVLYKVEKI